MEEHIEHSIFPEKSIVVYAPFGRRFAAALIDATIVAIPLTIVFAFLPRLQSVESIPILGTDISIGLQWRAYLVRIFVGWVYDAIQESGPHMATVGKRAMRIKVTDINGNGISFGKATWRHFGKTVSFILIFVGYFMMLWDEKRQTLHDKMAGTLVVMAD